MLTSLLVALWIAMQEVNPVGTYKLTFQPRSEIMTATLVIAARDSGRYRARIDMRQLRHVVTSDSVVLEHGRVRVYLPSGVADLTFEFGVAKPDNDTFLLHLDDGDMRGPLDVVRVPAKA